MVERFILNVQDSLKAASGICSHLTILILSAAIAFSIPWAAKYLIGKWSVVANEKFSLFAIEIAIGILLIIFLNLIRQSYHDRQLARMATWAGLVSFAPASRGISKKPMPKLNKRYGRGRVVKVLGSSGFSTFADQVGALSDLVGNCLGAQILLINPFSSEARRRVQALADPQFTLEGFRDEVMQSIHLLKRLKTMGKNVKLKLYADPPLFKLVILGDFLWFQHYHVDLDVQMMPEIVFQDPPNHHGLYTAFYQYFDQKWESHAIPDYDLDTDELVYRRITGGEIQRVPFFAKEGFKMPTTVEVEAKELSSLTDEQSFPVRE